MTSLADIDEPIRDEIENRLRSIEAGQGVRYPFAVESGSRAWGFPSPDSDYDVRFVYVRPLDWYLSIEPGRDVIETPLVDEIDLNGWDVRKALRLFWKSNPAFVEWIQSPITYREQGGFRANALHALPDVYTPEKGIYHYRSMDKTNYRGSRDTLHLVERFRRVGNSLRYEVTANDPKTWTAPWTAALELEPQTEGMFEYACHEGNNSMRNILSGARSSDAKH